MRHAAALRKAWLAFALAIFTASFLYASWAGIERPFRNWDMVAYVGAAISWQESDPGTIYKNTLEDAKAVVWPELYEDITTKNTLSKDRDAFLQQLPWYTIKPLYVGMVSALHGVFAVGYSQATFIISAASFLMLGVLLAAWRSKRLDWGVWLLLAVALTWLGNRPMADLARYSTPDALATLCNIAALFFLVCRSNFVAFVILAAAAILVRPDSLVLMVLACGIYAAGIVSLSRQSLMKAGAAALGFIVLYFTVQWAVGSYGWTKLFYYSFVNKTPYPATMEYELTITKYLEVLADSLGHIFSDDRLQPSLILSAVACFCYFMRPVAERKWPLLLAVAWTAFAARFILYPAWWEYRYYYAYYILVWAACGEMIIPYATLLWQRLMAHRKKINAQP